MNISRENFGELDLLIKIEIVESDYAEAVNKSLKRYQKQATMPGFRKGMVPMGMIQRMYKTSVVADEVENILSKSLFDYIEAEKLNIVGTPLSNEEKTGNIDFEKATDYTFYFDAAMAPEVKLAWDKVDVKMNQIKTTAKDVESSIDEITHRFGDFQTPEVIEAGDHVYGKAVELDKNGQPKEGGYSKFVSFDTATIKDEDIRNLFVGKKAEEKVVFNAGKAFKADDLQTNFHLEEADAKKFKCDIEFTISGASRIKAHEINEELFAKVFPKEEIKDAAEFKKAVQKNIEKANADQCDILYVNQVRKALIDNFDAVIPEAFLKRWILSRSDDKDLTPEKLEAEWAEHYIPSLKWEFIEGALNKEIAEQGGHLEPTHDDIINYIKNVLRENRPAGETEESEKELTAAAESIAKDRQNIQQLIDRMFSENLGKFLKEKLKPEVEKVTAKEFGERCKA